MKVSHHKRSPWVYAGAAAMVAALVAFSLLPSIGSLPRERGTPSNPAASPLEMEAQGYQLVLEREPDNQNALRGLLEVRLEQGNLRSAIAPLESLAQLNPQETDYALLLAQARQQLQDYEGAAATYRGVLATHPGDLPALKGLADLLVAQNRSAEAISWVQEALDRALSAQPESSDAAAIGHLTSLQLLLAEIYVQQQRYPEAMAVYERAIAGNGKDFRPWLGKALALQQQGKRAESDPFFQQAIDLAPVQYRQRIQATAASPGN